MILFTARFNPAPIYVNLSVVHWQSATTSTGYEPKHLAENKYLTEDKHFAEEKDLAEHEDLRVKPFFFHRPSIASTYDSAQSIATLPPESDLTMSKFELCWIHHCTCKRESNADRSQVDHSVRENLMSNSSQDPKSTGRPLRCFSSENWLNQETFSDREDLSSEHQQVLGNNEPLFRFSHPENSAKSLLEGHRDHMLAEAKSEIRKQECEVDSLNATTSSCLPVGIG